MGWGNDCILKPVRVRSICWFWIPIQWVSKAFRLFSLMATTYGRHLAGKELCWCPNPVHDITTWQWVRPFQCQLVRALKKFPLPEKPSVKKNQRKLPPAKNFAELLKDGTVHCAFKYEAGVMSEQDKVAAKPVMRANN